MSQQTISRIQSIEDAMQSYRLTRAQIEAASFHKAGDGSYFFLVQSASQPGVVYKVIYNPALKALQCVSFDGGPVCKASEEGFNCWHKRASMARSILIRLERRMEREKAVAAALATRGPEEIEEQRKIEEMVGQGCDRETATRVILAKPTRPSKKSIERFERLYEGDRTFRLLK